MRWAPDEWGAALGPGQGPGEPGGRRRAPSGREGRGRLLQKNLGWSRYPEERSLPLLPGLAPLDLRGEGRGPPAYEGRSAGGRAGDGQSRMGSGGGREPTRAQQRGRGSLELSFLQLGCVCVLWRLCCCECARLFSLKVWIAAAKAASLLSSVAGFASNSL